MVELHLPATDLELYVAADLPPSGAAIVERHVADCAACAAALARAAQFELMCGEVAAAPAPLPLPGASRHVRRRAVAGVAGLAVAAAAVIALAARVPRAGLGAEGESVAPMGLSEIAPAAALGAPDAADGAASSVRLADAVP